MTQVGRFIVVGACLVVACGNATSSSDASGGAGSASGGESGADTAGSAGAAEQGGAGAPGSAGKAGSPGSSAGSSAGGTSGAGNAAGSAGSSAGNAGSSAGSAGSSAGSAGSAGHGGGALFINQLLTGNPDLCLPRVLPVDKASGQITCDIVEAVAHSCSCASAGRAQTDAAHVSGIQSIMKSNGACGVSGQPACADFCMCQILQETGASSAACKADAVAAGMSATTSPGFCYVDDPASPQLASCPSNEKQKLLFVSKSNQATPSAGALVFLACGG